LVSPPSVGTLGVGLTGAVVGEGVLFGSQVRPPGALVPPPITRNGPIWSPVLMGTEHLTKKQSQQEDHEQA
jgi:hypothetical protein